MKAVDENGGNGWFISINTSSSNHIVFYYPGGGDYFVIGNAAVLDNLWHNVVVHMIQGRGQKST